MLREVEEEEAVTAATAVVAADKCQTTSLFVPRCRFTLPVLEIDSNRLSCLALSFNCSLDFSPSKFFTFLTSFFISNVEADVFSLALGV